MPELKVYNQSGAEVGTMELSEAVFGVPYNEALIHQVVVAQQANKRQGTHSNLTRTEVRGGGCKPWRQKGTGRARQGSIRSPQWTGGGVVFAKKPRDYSKGLNIKARRNALKSAISYKATNSEITIIDSLTLSAPKTKEVASILKNFSFKGSVLLVLPELDQMVYRAGRNIEKLNITYANLLNVLDIVKNVNIVTTKDGIAKIEEVCSL
ncbi:MAG: 50S ribosomal protein L4 [Bacillota bacterium]